MQQGIHRLFQAFIVVFALSSQVFAQEFPLPAPVLLDPSSGEEVPESPVRFEWGAVSGFDPTSHVYRLFITKLPSTTPGGDLPPMDATGTVLFVGLAAGSHYTYTVQVFEAGAGGAPLSPQPERIQFIFPFPQYPTFTPTATGIPTPSLDYNDDSVIDYADLWIFAEGWKESVNGSQFASPEKDLFPDGVIDERDLLRFIQIREEALDTPLPVSPPNGTIFSFTDFRDGRVVVEWTPVRNAVRYTVQVEGPRTAFPTQYFHVNAPQVTQVMGSYTLVGTYTWYVFAFDAGGMSSLASPAAFFHLNSPSPPTPTRTATPTVTPTPTVTITPSPTPTEPFVIDINGDNRLSAEDLFTFAAVWEAANGVDPDYLPAADLDNNGLVSLEDFYIFNRQWVHRRNFEGIQNLE